MEKQFAKKQVSIFDILQQAIAATDADTRLQLLQRAVKEMGDWLNPTTSGATIVGFDGRILRINAVLLDWVGFTEAEALGKMTLADFMTAESAEKYWQHFEHLTQTNQIAEPKSEYILVHPSGQKRTVMITENVFLDENNRLTRSASFITDISERKLAEQELQDLYNNAPVGYHSLDTEGVISRINDTALRWLGYSRDEVEGKMHITELMPEPMHTLFFENFPNFKKQGHVEDVLMRMRRKDGSTMPILLNAVAVRDDSGNYISSRSVMWDMTEKIKLEEELKRTMEQLYEANADKNRFIGVASHDLQNPITAIAMSAELLEKTTGTNTTPIQKKLLASIRSSAERMNAIVTNILNINRIERGMISDDWRDINLKTMIWDISNRYQIFATRKNIQLIQIADEGADWNVHTEPNYLIQAVENLLSNAIKFSHRNKKVVFELRRDDLNKEFTIMLADEGQGIKAEDMPLLFGKFQKLSARPTAGETSTGLGLSVAKEFIEILNGSIECFSDWGIGTMFIIHLPIEVVSH